MQYRVYFLDSSGWLLDFQLIDADTDEHVLTAVLADNPGRICQIWNERSLVAKVGANQPSVWPAAHPLFPNPVELWRHSKRVARFEGEQAR